MSQLLTQFQDLQNRVNSLSDAKESHAPESASRSGATHVPSWPSTVPSPRTMPCRDSRLPHDTRNIMGTSGNVFDRLPCSRRTTRLLSSTFQMNLASSSHELRPDILGSTKQREREMRREPQNLSVLVPHFQSAGGILNHTGGTCSHSGMIDYPRFPIWELRLGVFPCSMEFQSWTVNFKTEVCSKSADLHLTMHSIK